MREVIFVIFVWFSIFWGSVNLAKLIRGAAIKFLNFFFFSIGLTGVVTYLLGVW